MREHHALGAAGAAGRVLQERKIIGRRRGPQLVQVRRGAQVIDRHHVLERRHLRAQEARTDAHLGNRHQQHRAGVLEDTHLAAQMVLDARRPAGWIDRDRHAARNQDAKECVEEIQRGRQHHGHRVTWRQTAHAEAGGDLFGAQTQLRVCQRLDLVVVGEKTDVETVGMSVRMPRQHINKRSGIEGRARPVAAPWGRRLAAAPRRRGQARRSRFDGLQKVAHGRGRGKGRRQRQMEGSLQPAQQLCACKLVEAEILAQPLVEPNVELPLAARVHFLGQLAHDLQQAPLRGQGNAVTRFEIAGSTHTVSTTVAETPPGPPVNQPTVLRKLGRVMGFEPTTSGTTIRRSRPTELLALK